MKNFMKFLAALILGALLGALGCGWYFHGVMEDTWRYILEGKIIARNTLAQEAYADQNLPAAEFGFRKFIEFLDASQELPLFEEIGGLDAYYMTAHIRLARIFDLQGMRGQALEHLRNAFEYAPERVREVMDPQLMDETFLMKVLDTYEEWDMDADMLPTDVP